MYIFYYLCNAYVCDVFNLCQTAVHLQRVVAHASDFLSIFSNRHPDRLFVGMFQQNCFGPKCRTGVLVGGTFCLFYINLLLLNGV